MRFKDHVEIAVGTNVFAPDNQGIYKRAVVHLFGGRAGDGVHRSYGPKYGQYLVQFENLTRAWIDWNLIKILEPVHVKVKCGHCEERLAKLEAIVNNIIPKNEKDSCIR